MHPPRVVLDTNLLVGAAYHPASASRRMVDACLRGEVVALLSPALRQEYEHILGQAVRVPGYDAELRRFLEQATVVQPRQTPRVVPEDPDDDKLVAAALAGGAEVIVTSDRHLLCLNPYGSLRILRPGEFVRTFLEGVPAAERGRPDA
jgi:putative PIN family toxin of toxin-antitoxin system